MLSFVFIYLFRIWTFQWVTTDLNNFFRLRRPRDRRPRGIGDERRRGRDFALPRELPLPTDPPPIATKADDLEAIKKAVDDAASVGGGLWLSYFFVLFYLAVAAGAVTHADLFLENPVKLPFLNIELPLLAFFFLAPILFIIVHAYTLVHLVMLTDKAKRYHQALHDPRRNVIDARRAKICNGSCRATFSSNFSPDRPALRGGLFGWLLRAIGWATLVMGPVLLLLALASPVSGVSRAVSSPGPIA